MFCKGNRQTRGGSWTHRLCDGMISGSHYHIDKADQT